MESILQTLHELEGVHGAMVADGHGQVVAYRAHALYDAALLQQANRAIARAIDSVKLLHEQWESISVQFSDGRLLIRSIPGENRAPGSDFTLSLIADARLNLSFAGVAIRVAVSKLKAVLDGGFAAPPAGTQTTGRVSGAWPASGGAPPVAFANWQSTPMPASAQGALLRPSIPEATTQSLGWSGISGSGLSSSGIAAVDEASAAVLTACSRALAKSVGPIAKKYVKDAVSRLWPERPFSKEYTAALVSELEKHLENPADTAEFRKLALKSA